MERYIIVERYADNGELSHRALVDSTDGRELGTDGGEPEDQSFWRDWAWVPDELNNAQATVEALQAQLESANTLLHKKNCAIGKAETTIEALQRERDRYKAVLAGAEYEQLDKIGSQPIELCQALGQLAKQRYLDLQTALDAERDRLRANLVNCVARLEAYYGEDYPAVRDAKAALTPAGGGQE